MNGIGGLVSVLVVAEPSPATSAVCDELFRAPFDVWHVTSDLEAELACGRQGLGLVIIDLDDSEILLRRLRSAFGVDLRILQICGAAGEAARMRALLAGADDCVNRPYSPAEIVARAQAITRRQRTIFPPTREPLWVSGLQIDPNGRKVSRAGQTLNLTRVEFALLLDLALHAGIARSRQQLIDSVWGRPALARPQTVTVHMRRLRAKLRAAGEGDLINTIWSVGYRLDPPPADDEMSPREIVKEPPGPPPLIAG